MFDLPMTAFTTEVHYQYNTNTKGKLQKFEITITINMVFIDDSHLL